MTKPNSSTWRIGMPTIIANVSRSRRIWTNSFSEIANARAGEKRDPGAGDRSADIVGRVLHQVDEDVLERRFGAVHREFAARAHGCQGGIERLRVLPGNAQRRAERDDGVDALRVAQVPAEQRKRALVAVGMQRDAPRRKPRVRDDLVGGAFDEELSIRDVHETM